MERSSKWQIAVLLLEEVERSLQADVIIYNASISATEKAAEWPWALHLLQRALRREVPVDVITHNAAISACEKAGEWQRALDLFHQMTFSRFQVNSISCNAVISACDKAAEWLCALHLLQDALQQRLVDVITYNAAISACEKSAKWEEALHLLSDLHQHHVQSTVVTYSAAVSACEKAQRWQQGLVLLAEACMRFDPDIVIFNAAISACEKAAEWQQALQLFDDLGSSRTPLSPSIVTYSAMASACGRAGEWKQALLFLEEVDRNSLRADVVTHNAAMSACEKAQQWASALHLLHDLYARSIQPSIISYSATMSACEQSGEGQITLDLLKDLEVTSLQANLITFNSAISAAKQLGNWEEVLSLLEELALRGFTGTVATFAAALGQDEMMTASLLQQMAIAAGPSVNAAGAVLVNGRLVTLGQPQVAWIPGADALLLHSPLDAMAPQLLVQRPADPAGAIPRALHLPALQPREPAAHRVRPTPEEGFVLVPHGWAPFEESESKKDDIFDLTAMGPGLPTTPTSSVSAAFTAMTSILFFQPSTWRVVQLDVLREITREVYLEHVLPAAVKEQWQLSSGFPVMVSATGTTNLGIEMLLAPTNQGRKDATQSFLSLFFPSGDPQAMPRARLVESQRGQTRAGGVLPLALPGGPTAGVTAVPFGSEASIAFAGDEVPGARGATSTNVANLLEGQAQDDGSKAVWAYLTDNMPPAVPRNEQSWPSTEELTLAPEEQIKALVSSAQQALPSERGFWRSQDVVCLGSELILRAMSDGSNGDWLEFIHLPSRSARQLPAAIEGMEMGSVARILPWPKAKLFQGDENASNSGRCVVIFQRGHVRWMEAHPRSLAESLQDHFHRQGLRGTMEEQLPPEDSEQEEMEDLEDLELEELEELEAELEEDAEGGPNGPKDHDPVDDAGQSGAPSRRPPGGSGSQRGRGPTTGQPVTRPSGQTGGAGGAGAPRGAKGKASDASGTAPGRGEAAGPQAVRRKLLRRALRQRRQAQKMRDLSGGGREEMAPDGKAPKEVSSPKHGDEDDKEHIGGNRWAGGSGGADTAGLGGRGGPYRLEKPGQRVRQVSDEAKAQVDAEAAQAAKQLGQEALRRRLEEIHLSGGDYNFYSNLLSSVQGEIERLRAVLSGAAARQLERHWRRGQEGELDETRLVDALAGEANVFRRRKEREPRPGEPPMRPKRALFLFDASASMYRFNGSDGRLRRTCETAVMIMEALQGLEARFDYAVYCHDGDTPLQELVPFGQPPSDERGRLAVVSKLVASAQYCSSGDNTVEAIEQARQKVLEAGVADDRFVFAFSDANFERYGLTAQALSKALGENTNARDEVRSMLFLLATFEDEALIMAKSLPDQVRLCLDPRTLPSELRQEFASRVNRRSAL
eukprot:symbB.v1.2.000130.t1/scaffold16.1/size461936/4